MAAWSARLRAVFLALASAVPLPIFATMAALSSAHARQPDMSDTMLYTPAPAPVVRSPEAESRVRAIELRYRQAELGRVRSIRFTAREEGEGSGNVRHWIWLPGPDSVYFQGIGPKGIEMQVGYGRKNPLGVTTIAMSSIDSAFCRDRFILFFPVLFATEPQADILFQGKYSSRRERAGRDADWLHIAYPADDRVRPWRIYDVLADTGGVIRAWTVRDLSGDRPVRFTWSPPENVDGLPLSLERKGSNGFAIRFTDVAVAWLRP